MAASVTTVAFLCTLQGFSLLNFFSPARVGAPKKKKVVEPQDAMLKVLAAAQNRTLQIVSCIALAAVLGELLHLSGRHIQGLLVAFLGGGVLHCLPGSNAHGSCGECEEYAAANEPYAEEFWAELKFTKTAIQKPEAQELESTTEDAIQQKEDEALTTLEDEEICEMQLGMD